MRVIACSRFASVDELIERALAICGCDFGEYEDALIEAALDQASDVLAQAAGGSFFGLCRYTARPTPAWGFGANACTDDAISMPVDLVAVESVKINGVTLADDEYRLVPGRGLVRINPDTNLTRAWPSCQHVHRDSTEDGTFEIVYVAGTAPGPTERDATIELACRILRGLNPNVLEDVETASGGGLTVSGGSAELHFAPLFRALWNPRGLSSSASFYSPDTHLWDLNITVADGSDATDDTDGRRTLTLVAGDSGSWDFLFQDAAGDPISITGRTYQAEVRTATGVLTLTLTCTVIDGPNGLMRATIASGLTSVTPGVYYWDLEETNGSAVTTLFAGSRFVIKAGVTA